MLPPWKCCQQKGRGDMGAPQVVAQALGVAWAVVVAAVGISSLSKGVSACLPGRVSCCQPGAMYTAAEENSQHAGNFFLHLLANVSNRVTLVLVLTYVLTWL